MKGSWSSFFQPLRSSVCQLSIYRSQGISVGYNSTGKKACAMQMEPYGEAFGPGDTITVLVDLTGVFASRCSSA